MDKWKANLNKRLKELESKKTSAVMDAMMRLVALFDEGKIDESGMSIPLVKLRIELQNQERR